MSDLQSGEHKIGTWIGSNLYRRCYSLNNTYTAASNVDATITSATARVVSIKASGLKNGEYVDTFLYFDAGTLHRFEVALQSAGLILIIANESISNVQIEITYTK